MSQRALDERIRNAGTNLSSVIWGRRPTTPPRLALTPRDLALLERLYELKYLTTSHLVAFGWGRDTSTPHDRLKRLHDAGLMDKFRAPHHAGSHEWTYRITTVGWQRLVGAGLAPSVPAYRPAELHSIAYAEHDLELNGLIVDIARRTARRATPLLHALPFRWYARSSRVALDAGQGFVHRSAAAQRDAKRYHRAKSRGGYLEPDAVLRGYDTDGRALSILIEYDRTGRPSTQIERLQRYDRFLLDAWRDTTFASDDETPVVLYITPDEARAQALIQAADSALTAWEAPPEASPQEGLYPGRGNTLFTSRERLIAGDWTVQYLPPRPSLDKRDRNVVPLEAAYRIPEVLIRRSRHAVRNPRAQEDRH